MTKKICGYCKKEIVEGEEFTDFFNIFAHKSCEEEYFKRQEKNIKYITRRDRTHEI